MEINGYNNKHYSMLIALIFYITYMFFKIVLIIPHLEKHYDALCAITIALVFIVCFHFKSILKLKYILFEPLNAGKIIKTFSLWYAAIIVLILINTFLFITDYDNFNFNKQLVFSGGDKSLLYTKVCIDIVIHSIIIGAYIACFIDRKKNILKISPDSIIARYKISNMLWNHSLWSNTLITILIYALLIILDKFRLEVLAGFLGVITTGIFILLLYENYKKVCLNKKPNNDVVERNIFNPTIYLLFVIAPYSLIVIIDHYFPFSININYFVMTTVFSTSVPPILFTFVSYENKLKKLKEWPWK
ncbi:MAG: hypothetical protein HQK52_20390 [Oligoflexia bacterium]|nr:hypothetical protein [Oligoflexia bacterium]